MRIDITPIDLEFEKIIEGNEFYIELLSDRLRYRINYKASHPIDDEDLSRGWDDKYIDYLVVCRRDYVSGVIIDRTKNQKWKISIEFSGMSADIIRFFYEKEIEAIDTFRKIEAWIFEKSNPAPSFLTNECDIQSTLFLNPTQYNDGHGY